MSAVTIEQAQASLPELIALLAPGDELVILQGTQPVAKLVRQGHEKPTPVFGRGLGKVVIVSEDDEHLQAFQEYMP